MKVTKCDICGAVFDDISQMREVQIRKRKSLYDSRPIIEKTYDACIYCINRFLGTEGEDTYED